MTGGRLVTARELGEVLSLSPSTVLDKWERGELPGYRIGRAVRFDVAEILSMTRKDVRRVGEVRPKAQRAAHLP